MQIKKILKNGINELNSARIAESTLKARMLLSSLLNVSKEYLITHDLDEVSKEDEKGFFEGIDRLKKNEPIQYIIGKQEFFGLEFLVNENVLIPQPDTEILVEETLKIAQKYGIKKIKLLDLCTGSGAIVVVLAKNLQNVEAYASDISEKAVEVAKENASKNNASVKFICSDLFENIDEKFDIIVSNPPYIETATIATLEKEVQNEPKLALDGGIDGLDFYRKIANQAKQYLNSEGYLILEIGYNQKEMVMEILEENEYKNVYCKKDFAGNNRVICAKA